MLNVKEKTIRISLILAQTSLLEEVIRILTMYLTSINSSHFQWDFPAEVM